ncbi:unnamed protein product [Ectocarpus sp. 12 AP-2014]
MLVLDATLTSVLHQLILVLDDGSRQTSLVCITGVAGVVAYIGALFAYGVIERHDGDFLANCAVEGLFDYTGWGVWTSVALVRVYRSWKLLCRHSVDMWPAWAQVALLSIPWLVPVVAYSVKPSLSEFNELGNWCDINVAIDTALYVYGCVPIIGAFFLSFQMRRVRKQMNFYRMQVLQLLFLFVTGTIIFPLLEESLHSDIRRRWIMYDNVVSSTILFWPPIIEPLYRKLSGDEGYLYSYTKGFSQLPTPAQMRSCLKDQLSLDELRCEFEKFADSKVARELPDFYKACLDREDISDFFERQAVTTAIIDRFIRVDAVQEVNISGALRNKILTTEITRYNIFDEAMSAVLKIMDTNFSFEFKETEAFKNLEQVVKDEAEELELLRKMNQLPEAEHVEPDSKGLMKFIRRATDSAATGSSKDGSESRCSITRRSSPATLRSSHPEAKESLEDELDDDFDDDPGNSSGGGDEKLCGHRRGVGSQRDPKPVAEEGRLCFAPGAVTGTISMPAAGIEAEVGAGTGEAVAGSSVVAARVREATVAPASGAASTLDCSRPASALTSKRTRPSPSVVTRTSIPPTAVSHSSNTIFAVGNPRAVSPQVSASASARRPLRGYARPSAAFGGWSGGGGGGGLTDGAGAGLSISHVSLAETYRSSEDSASVSWRSDTIYTHGSSECSSSVSGRGPGGSGQGRTSGVLVRRAGYNGGGVYCRSSSNLSGTRHDCGDGSDGGFETHQVAIPVSRNGDFHDDSAPREKALPMVEVQHPSIQFSPTSSAFFSPRQEDGVTDDVGAGADGEVGERWIMNGAVVSARRQTETRAAGLGGEFFCGDGQV